MANNRKYPCISQLLLLALMSGYGGLAVSAESADEPSAAVTTRSVRQEPIAQTVRAYGVVSVGPDALNSVSLPYTARVTRMLVAPGQSVTRGQPLFEVSADPANILADSQAASALTLAKGELSRTRALFDKQLATQSQLSTAQKSLDDAQQAYAVQQRLGVSAQPKMIGAPFDGTVSQITVTRGDRLQPGAAVMQLTRKSGAHSGGTLILGVDPDSVSQLQPGDKLSAHGLASSQPLSGRVLAVSDVIDGQTQLVNVIAKLDDSTTHVLAGTRIVADIALSSQNHWVVPRSAVLQDDQGAYLYQVQARKAQRVEVTIAVEQADRYGVDGALQAALPVIVTGNYELQNGMSVRVAGEPSE